MAYDELVWDLITAMLAEFYGLPPYTDVSARARELRMQWRHHMVLAWSMAHPVSYEMVDDIFGQLIFDAPNGQALHRMEVNFKSTMKKAVQHLFMDDGAALPDPAAAAALPQAPPDDLPPPPGLEPLPPPPGLDPPRGMAPIVEGRRRRPRRGRRTTKGAPQPQPGDPDEDPSDLDDV